MRAPKKKPFSTSRKCSKFKVSNWSAYNNILRNRGRIDFMIAEDLSDGWYEDYDSHRKRGGQRRYSDKAIFMCLQIRYLFGLKLRQSQGFINWIFMVSDLALTCPDYTTLSKRGRSLNLEFLLASKENDFDYICMDSTGIQTYTGNEWLENKHGKQYIRRTWKKLHIAIGNNGIITSATTTCHNKDDRSQIQALLKGINTKEVLADPGYDGENIYQMLRAKASSQLLDHQIILLPKRRKRNVSKVLRINKLKAIMHGGRNTNMDVGSW